jgi:hypothetical protein
MECARQSEAATPLFLRVLRAVTFEEIPRHE